MIDDPTALTRSGLSALVLDALPDGVAVVDGGGRIVFVNTGLAVMTGYTPAELEGHPVEHLVPEAARAQHRGLRRGYQQRPEGRPMGAMAGIHCRRSDGSEFPADVSLSPVETPEGTLVIAAVRDATTQRAVHHQVERLSRLYAVLAGATEAMVSVTHEMDLFAAATRALVEVGGLRLANVTMLEHDGQLAVLASHGRFEGALTGPPVQHDVAGEFRWGGRTPAGRAVCEDRAFVCNDIATLEGMPRWRSLALLFGAAAVASVPIRRDGAVVGALTVFADDEGWFSNEDVKLVAELADALAFFLASVDVQRELAESEDRLRRLAEDVPDMIYRYRLVPDEAFDYMSPAFEAVTGFQTDHLLSDPKLHQRLLHPDDMRKPLASVDENPTLRVRMRRADGTWVWTEHRATLVRGDDGKVIAVEGIARDISDQIRAESELVESERISRSVLESLAGPSAVLDRAGTVVRANQAWAEYAAQTDNQAVAPESSDYLAVLDAAAAAGLAGGAEAAAGVRAVLSGTESSFLIDYPDPSSDGERWFAARVTPLATERGGAVVTHIDITQRKRYEQQLTHQALHDPLTKLPNRALLEDRLGGALARAHRQPHSVAVLFLDIDHFKVLNDGRGHAAGDRVLVAVSERLAGIMRPEDTVARFGGDEFVVLCEGIEGEAEARSVAERISAGFDPPFDDGTGGEVAVSVSIGIAFGNADGRPETVLRDADAAMYQAKDRGRNRYEFFDRQLRARVVARLSTEADLHLALERDELRLFYQALVRLDGGDLVGAEALLRWDHPSRGLLAPGEFLDVAEETGLVVPIGAWVLDQACRQVRRWRTKVPEDFRIGVNLSARQLVRPELVVDICSVLEANGVSGNALTLELTETILMEPKVSAISMLRALRSLGTQLSIDDFGTGYSSLSYLKRFPVHTVKIDRSFVDGLGNDPDDSAIVRAIIGMAHALGLGVVAEGVETDAQRRELVALGCDYAQGYLFGAPLPADEFEECALRAL